MTGLDIIADATRVIVAACAPIIAWKLASYVGMQGDMMAVQTIDTALERGAGLALDHGLREADPLLLKASNKSSALRVANGYVQDAAGAAGARLGVGETDLAIKLSAVLANKLHAPTVIAAQPPASAVSVTVSEVAPPSPLTIPPLPMAVAAQAA